MNWSLLLPSTWNPLSAFRHLLHQNSQIASQALSDSFIFVIIGIAVIFGFLAVKLAIASLVKTGRYLHLLLKADDAVKRAISSNLPLFCELQRHLLPIPSRDGTEVTTLCRIVDASEIFRNLTLAPNFTNSRLFHAVPGILTGIGVLGTFVGLQMGIGGLDLKELKNLEKSIVPLIQGCAVAFSTSVWGVFTSLMFSGLEKILENMASIRIRKLQNCVDALIPRYVPEKSMAELERTSRGTEDILKGLAVAIGDQMQKAIGRLGAEIKDAVSKAASEGKDHLMEKSVDLLSNAITGELINLKKQIGDMAEQFYKQFSGVSGELMSSIKSFDPTVKTLSKSVTLAQRTVTEAVDKLNAHEMVMEKMAAASTEIRQAAESFVTMKDTLKVSSARNEEAAKAQLAAAQKNEEVAEKFDQLGKGLPEIQNTLKDAGQVISSISGPISELKAYLEILPDNQKVIENERAKSEDERNKRLVEMSNGLAEKVGKAAEQFAKVSDLADKLTAAAANLDDASNKLTLFGSQVLDASKEQRESSEAARAAALSGERTAKALEPFPRHITQLTTGLQVAGESVEKGAAAARDSYRELVLMQKQWFSGAEIGLTAMRDRLQAIINAYGSQIEGQTRNLMNQWTKEVTECLQTYEHQVEELQGGLDELQSVINHLKKSYV